MEVVVLVGWLWSGEIRGYGWEIRGEISQHLAAHMHTRPSWETQPQIRAWTTWKRHQHWCRREETHSLLHSLSLAVFLSPNLPCICSLSSSFILSSSPRLPSLLSFSYSSPRRFFKNVRVCPLKKRECALLWIFFFFRWAKMSNKHQTGGWNGRCFGDGRRKIHYMANGLFKGSHRSPSD